MYNEKDKAEMERRVRAGRFRENNGVALQTINLVNGPEKYAPLRDVEMLLKDAAIGIPMTEDEIVKSINFLQMAEYITLRDMDSREERELADLVRERAEAKLSVKGVRLLSCSIKDDEVVFKAWR